MQMFKLPKRTQGKRTKTWDKLKNKYPDGILKNSHINT